ncbi:MAG TPA: hypothetical protein VMI72_03315 [Roseiarcus sp.]|nr:hypothetical protein [Roseiarcus sp.]
MANAARNLTAMTLEPRRQFAEGVASALKKDASPRPLFEGKSGREADPPGLLGEGRRIAEPRAGPGEMREMRPALARRDGKGEAARRHRSTRPRAPP